MVRNESIEDHLYKDALRRQYKKEDEKKDS